MSDKFQTIICNIASKFPWNIRCTVYQCCGLISGRKYDIRKNVYFDHVCNVKLGKHCMINQYVQFHVGQSKEATIELGEKVYVGMNVTFICVSHEIGNCLQRAGSNTYKNISVGNGAWIGANSVILSGVSIGRGCIIGAGSVVIRDCEENCMYAGNPARKIKSLNDR